MKLPNTSYSISIFIFAIIFFVLPGRTEAIPAFARKYKTSCATCHVGYPKLTPFGEAYRLNGFQMPEDEEGSIKEEPVKMGAEAYKRVWPNAIWPGSIPGTPPVSFRIRSGLNYVNDETGTYTEFGLPTLQMMTGGSFNENISFFAGAHLFEEGTAGSIDRLYIRFNHMFANKLPYNLVNIRIGQFVPDIVTYITNHRGLTHTAYALNTYAPEMTSFGARHVHGSSAFGIEGFQLGAEASGLISSQLRYVLGLVNGNGVSNADNNAAKDFYGKFAFKLGGLMFDGTSVGEIYGAEANNWAEKSVTISVFGYLGSGTYTPETDETGGGHFKMLAKQTIIAGGDHDSTMSEGDFNFNRFGFDYNLFLRDLNLFGGYISGTDDEHNYTLIFTEANYMFYPWLIGVLRYERAAPENKDTISQFVTHLSALYTANVRFSIESRFNPDELELSNLVVGLDFAF